MRFVPRLALTVLAVIALAGCDEEKALLTAAPAPEVKLAASHYRGGVSIYLEVLAALQDLFESELQLLQVTRGVYSSVVELYAALGGAWREGPVEPPAARPSSMVNAASAVAGGNNADRIEVTMEGPVSVVNVHRTRGIGGAMIRRPRSGWPPAVRVRLHDFQALDGFSARSTAATLRCETQGTLPGVPHVCSVDGGAPLDLVRRRENEFELELPSALLANDVDSVEVRWVDRYR